MTSRNSQWNELNITDIAADRGNLPFLLKPAGKDYLWGGNRLNDDFAKNIDMQPLAETWECSTHPDGPSLVASGRHQGMTLSDLLRQHPEYLGTHPRCCDLPEGQLPILIKFIDASKDLSVQVHPDDAYARAHENGQLGKTEMWYVLDAAKDASLIYGLYHDQTREQLLGSIEAGTVEKYLQRIPVQKNDVFFIESGTIHAIGAGALVAEIQENSNLTYRLYDYDRVDKDGNKRQLHVEKALAVANLKAAQEPAQPLRVLRYQQGCATETLCRCKYFEVHRMLINTERCRQMVAYRSDSLSFRVLLCIDGCGTVICEGESIHFFRGDCIFIPADSAELQLHGQAQFLDVRG